MRKSLLACAALVAAVVSTPSLAGSLDKPPQITVAYSDLNLSRTDGANTLLGRLDAAARIVCGYESVERRSLRDMADYRKCYNAAMDGAVAEVDNRLVAQVYGKPALVAANHGDGVVADARVILSSR